MISAISVQESVFFLFFFKVPGKCQDYWQVKEKNPFLFQAIFVTRCAPWPRVIGLKEEDNWRLQIKENLQVLILVYKVILIRPYLFIFISPFEQTYAKGKNVKFYLSLSSVSIVVIFLVSNEV